MALRITFQELMEQEGVEDQMEYLEDLIMDGVVPALCDGGCLVEPDGECHHGHPSVLLALGLI